MISVFAGELVAEEVALGGCEHEEEENEAAGSLGIEHTDDKPLDRQHECIEK